MKQIDLEPKDYKASPIKGEPIFVPGAGKRVAIHVGIFVGMAVICVPVYLLVTWLMAPLEPLVRGVVSSILSSGPSS